VVYYIIYREHISHQVETFLLYQLPCDIGLDNLSIFNDWETKWSDIRSSVYVAPWWKASLIKLFYNRHHPLVVCQLDFFEFVLSKKYTIGLTIQT